ncbi:MAG: hypothetical protein K8S94_05480 [Planctomycetia bacterium]|nr:hypothetical protein [Planctomycetia bacterium]
MVGPLRRFLAVFALTASHTGEIAKQYQIVSLIVVRRVFKDIGSFSELENWLAGPDAVRAVLIDMAGAVLMFLIVTACPRRWRRRRPTSISSSFHGFLNS